MWLFKLRLCVYEQIHNFLWHRITSLAKKVNQKAFKMRDKKINILAIY